MNGPRTVNEARTENEARIVFHIELPDNLGKNLPNILIRTPQNKYDENRTDEYVQHFYRVFDDANNHTLPITCVKSSPEEKVGFPMTAGILEVMTPQTNKHVVSK